MKHPRLLAGICVLLAGVLTWQLSSPGESDSEAPIGPAAAGASSRPATGATAPEPDLMAAATAALGRPLFSHDRRPGDDDRQAPKPAQDGDAMPRLSGVIVGPGRHRALFTDQNGRSRDATEGDAIGRYIIHGIQPGIVVLLGPEGERVLYTSYAKEPGAKDSGSKAGSQAGTR